MSDIKVIERKADISKCGQYRYVLHRGLSQGSGSVLWVMLNPSTADATIDDPTLRKCIGFTGLWGFREVWVVNLYALRATNPKELKQHVDPIGPLNDKLLDQQLFMHDRVVFGWGNNGTAQRSLKVRNLYHDAVCLGVNKNGSPEHPLYIPYEREPVPYDWARRQRMR